MLRRSIFCLFVVLSLLQIVLSQFPFDYAPNCEEVTLFSRYVDLGDPTFTQAFYAKLFALQKYGSYALGSVGDAYTNAMWGALMVSHIYQFPGSSYPVNTLEQTKSWAILVSEAHECLTQSCCQANAFKDSWMDLHNLIVGAQLAVDLGGPLKSDADYISAISSLTSTAKWFSPNRPQGALCASNSTLVYYNPTPSNGQDAYENDDCELAATNLNSTTQNHNFHVASDIDYFFFCPTPLVSYSISLSGYNNSSAPVIRLFSQGSVVASSSSGNLLWTAGNSNSTVYVQLSPQSFQSIQSYSIGMSYSSISTCILPTSSRYSAPQYTIPSCTPYTTSCTKRSSPVTLRSGMLTASINSSLMQYSTVSSTSMASFQMKLGDPTISPIVYQFDIASFQEQDGSGGSCTSQTTTVGVPSSVAGPSTLDGAEVQSLNVSLNLPNCAQAYFVNYLFDKRQTIVYSGNSIVIDPNSIKLSLNITNWPFTSTSNRLVLVINVIASAVSFKENRFVVDSQGNLRELRINSTSGGVPWRFRFETTAIADGRIVPCTVKFYPTLLTDPLHGNLVFEFPYFSNYLFYDPDFSVLLGGESTTGDASNTVTGNEKKSSISGATIGIIVAVIAAIIIVTVFGIVIFTRKRKDHMAPILLKIRNSTIPTQNSEQSRHSQSQIN